MSDLQTKIKNINIKYKDLKKCEQKETKQKLCEEILQACNEIQGKLDRLDRRAQIFRWTRQIADIKKKVMEILEDNAKDKANKEKDEEKSAQYEMKIVQRNSKGQRLSKQQIQKILELQAQNMEASNQQIEKLLVKMQQNLAINEDIRQYVHDQGNDLEAIEQNLIKAYKELQHTEKDLKEAAQIQHKTRLQKIRLGISGIIGAFGYAFFGIPGAIVGVFGGFKLGRKQKAQNSTTI